MNCLNLPPFDYQLKSSNQGRLIFDVVRKRYVCLTPEEWVRQHFLHYLINDLAYPRTLLRLEQGIRYNRLQQRADILVYDRTGQPLLLVECKASHVPLDDDTWHQIARYNASINAQLLVMTNGLQHFCWQLDYQRGIHRLLPSIPSFNALIKADLETM